MINKVFILKQGCMHGRIFSLILFLNSRKLDLRYQTSTDQKIKTLHLLYHIFLLKIIKTILKLIFDTILCVASHWVGKHASPTLALKIFG